MITRAILEEARYSLHQFRALCITGPRQSGKTTLCKMLAPDKPYINFEFADIQAEAEKNPKTFLSALKKGAVLDEVQRVPVLFRYLQPLLDDNTQRGQFILTGSNNFLLQEQIAQSLAGRAGYLSLLPFSYAELFQAGKTSALTTHILHGGYPEIWAENIDPSRWLNSYIQTYVQRDVRLLRNITNLGAFSRFIQLCAHAAGQIINRDELAKDTGVDNKTIQAWLALLENSYIIYLLQPWYNNLNKRIIKSPKLYFYDTGLLCHLLGITKAAALAKHRQYGSIFENWIITEIRKNKWNQGETNGMYFLRDSSGNEVDLIMEKNDQPLGIEIKSAAKFDTGMLKGLRYWIKYQPQSQGLLLHGGTSSEIITEKLSLLSWDDVKDI